MKVSDMSSNGARSDKRVSVSSASGNPSKQASSSDNSPVMMNKAGMKSRGSRADELVEMVGDDSYRLGTEAPRKSKMKG